MASQAGDTDELLNRAAHGDHAAVGSLMTRHRARLRQAVALRLDPRVAPRVDPSDVVQETLAEASTRLPDYLRRRPLPFYPWLRQIAGTRLDRLHEQHVEASKRSVQREHRDFFGLTDASVGKLARRLIGTGATPSQHAIRTEQRQRLRAALGDMRSTDREVLVMWHLEGLSVDEIAAVLGLTAAGVKSRHLRALTRLTSILNQQGGWE
jgi:RNA polymerase sigma-70 factor (ECF subfamily)